MKKQSSQVATSRVVTVTVSGKEQSLPQWKVNGLVALGEKYLAEKRDVIRAQKAAEKERIAAEQAAAQRQLEAKQHLEQAASVLGISVEQLLQAAQPRANSATPEPSQPAIMVDGVYMAPCKAVHAIAAKHTNRKDCIEECVRLGINKYTAQTQWGVYRKEVAKAAPQQEGAAQQ